MRLPEKESQKMESSVQAPNLPASSPSGQASRRPLYIFSTGWLTRSLPLVPRSYTWDPLEIDTSPLSIPLAESGQSDYCLWLLSGCLLPRVRNNNNNCCCWQMAADIVEIVALQAKSCQSLITRVKNDLERNPFTDRGPYGEYMMK